MRLDRELCCGDIHTHCCNFQNFRFKTRLQRLNSLEGSTRASSSYLEGLFQFWAQMGKPLAKLPQLDRRPIDLYLLKKEVDSKGGYNKVSIRSSYCMSAHVLIHR